MRLRLVLICLLVTLTVGAGTAASASAKSLWTCAHLGGPLEGPTCSAGGSGGWDYVLMEEAELFGAKAWESMALKGSGLPTIACGLSEGTGSMAEASSTSTVTYKECKVVAEPNCTVSTSIVAEEHGQIVEVAGKSDIEFTAKNSETGVIATITLKNAEGKTCATKGTYDLKGHQRCLLVEASTGKVTHKTECLASGGELTLGGKKTEYTGGEEMNAVSGKAWLVE